ncbi:major facilitator superfamily domain-containing protein 3 isoform X2 [Nothobranchius furzeri]|uniref:major facilitator superfamily domain-containing protein 3 isoform X2 n=1 Tax=Nothobranchius furzeri TaxID=105023 RepID=UPI00390498DE
MNDKLVFLGLLYFVQGIPYGLQSSLLPVYLRGAGHSLTRIGFTKILYFPWVLKVLWAPLVDRVGTKRRWLVGTVSGLALACLSSAALAPEAHIWGVAGTLLAMNTLASVQDIAVDGAAVGLLKGRGELGLGNTAQVVGYKAGSVFAGGGLLAVIDVAGWSWMFMLLTFVYAGVALFVWGAPVLDDETLRSQQADGRKGAQGTEAVRPWKVWRKLMAVPGTSWTILYVLTYKLGEQGAVTMFPLFLLDHHMTARELGFWNGVIAMGFSICGSSLGGLLLAQFRYTYLLESVLDLANCCEGCFLHQGKDSSVIHHSCFPWSSGSFGAAELTGFYCFFSLMMACFTDSDSSLDLILTVDSNRFQMHIAHLK